MNKSGRPGLVLYLKACNVLLMQSTGGMILKGTRDLGVAVSRTSDGIPRIIPRVMRNMIRQGDRNALRIWLSLFSLYRVIDYPGSLKLSTITEPGPPLKPESYWATDITAFANVIGVIEVGYMREFMSDPIKAMIYKSSPSTANLDGKSEFKYSTSWVGIQRAAYSLFNHEI